MTNSEILLGTNDYRDLFISKFISERLKIGKSTVTEKICVIGNHKKATDFVRRKYMAHKMFSYGYSRFVIDRVDTIIEIETNANTVDFRVHGSFDDIDIALAEIKKEFEEISIYISWVYDQNLSTATVPIDSTLVPFDEMYNFLGDESLESYYKRFMESSASILILLGAPGTGKTSFIRGFLTTTESSAMVTYDQAILSKDGLFSDFIEGNSNVLVLEDADLFLSSRKEGNEMMHRFLNVGDGLVTVKGKKIIFSTNLPNIKDIDSALLRPGRCFDILHFNELNVEESQRLVDKLGIDFTFSPDRTSYSIAEIFSGIRNNRLKTPKGSFGFMGDK